jgi:hypothetical protein
VKCPKCGHEEPEKKEEFNFEEIYKRYPKKIGKSVGFRRLRASVKSERSFIDLQTALDRFCEFHTQKGTTKEYYPHFSTFTTTWRDWLDNDAGTVQLENDIKPISELIE